MSTGKPGRFIEVKVRLHASRSSLREGEGGRWIAELRAPPVEGKANAELIALIARHFGCQQSSVSIKRGLSSRLKLVRIEA